MSGLDATVPIIVPPAKVTLAPEATDSVVPVSAVKFHPVNPAGKVSHAPESPSKYLPADPPEGTIPILACPAYILAAVQLVVMAVMAVKVLLY